MGIQRFDGVIEKVFRAEKDGMCRFTLSTMQSTEQRGKNGTVLCVYIASRLREGLPVTITGTWAGDMFEVGSMAKRYDRKEVYSYLVSHCRKIGKVAAENALDALGSRIFSVSADEIRKRLQDVGFDKHLTAAQMEELGNRLSADDGSLCAFLDYMAGHKAEMPVCERIYEVKEGDSLPYVKRLPYGCCMTFGLGFACADSIARENGISPDVPARLKALMWTVLEQAKENGDSFLPLPALLKEVNALSGREDGSRQYTALKLRTLAGSSARFHVDRDRIYQKELYEAEEDVAGMLRAISTPMAKYRAASPTDISRLEKEYGISYAAGQKAAFAAAGIPGVSMIIGGPGTGKTTVMKGIADTFCRNNPDKPIALCAPTGRAAKRLAEATGRAASTIHSLLHYVPYTNTEELRNMHTHDNPLDASLIILDEVSMVSLPLFRLFLDAVKPGTSVVLVGDRNQLPSVEVGNVLSDLMASGCFPVYELSANFRQAGAGGLEDCGDRILAGETPGGGEGVEIIKSGSPEESLILIEGWHFTHYDPDKPFGTQMLAPSYKGAAGITAVNAAVQVPSETAWKITKGDKVIFTRTSQDPDGDAGYINGDMGIITEMKKGTVKIRRDWDGKTVSYPDSVLEDIQAAYDMSIHRSQGSEFADVLVYLPQKPRNMLRRNLLYTAVTRAKKSVAIIYEGTALQDAVSNSSALDRYSGLAERIRKKFGKQ